MQPSSDFSRRLHRIAVRERETARSHVLVVDEAGILKKRAMHRRQMRLPLQGVALLFLGFVLFKALILASLGPAAYADRLASLQDGTALERAGAWALQAEPLTRWLASFLSPIF